MIITNKVKELQGVIDLLVENTQKDIDDFPVMTAEEIMDSANNKDGLMRELITVKGELDALMVPLQREEILKYESIFIDLEEKMMQFKILNRRLMLLTLPIQEMYNDINNKVKQTNSSKKNSLNISV